MSEKKPWWTKVLLTEEDGALPCYFCGKLVHIPGMRAHLDCLVNAVVELFEKGDLKRRLK